MMIRNLIMSMAAIFLGACVHITSQTIIEGKDMSDTIKINYIELPVTDLVASKTFYAKAFGWDYVDYGPTYASFTGAGIDGGLDADADRKPSSEGALVVLYAKDLHAAQALVESAGGEITVAIFAFPGGRRFHFNDPSGNELAVWSEE